LVALISIQPQDVGLPFKGTDRNQIGEAPGHTSFGSFLRLLWFPNRPLFAETGTSYSAARIGQIRSGAEQIAWFQRGITLPVS